MTKVASHAAETMDGIVHGAPLVDNAGGAAKLTNGATGSVAHDASLEHVTPASAASDALAGSVKHVNISGSGQNCTNCAYSVDNQLATGAKSSALPRSEGVPFAKLNEMYKTNFSGWVSKSSIEKGMLSSGEGTRAIIYGMDAKGRTAHVWNAIVQNGSVNYIDGQTGGSGLRNFTDFAKFRFGITGGGR